MLFEKYRPQNFDQLIGRDEIVAQVKKEIASKDGISHYLFYGPSGTGKTTMARIIARAVFKEEAPSLFFEFNASDDRGIDFVRTQISEIAKLNPVQGPYKIILMDEADHITHDAQAAFRALLEKFSKRTRFIFTANYPYKITKEVKSRFCEFEFPALEVKQIALMLKKIGIKEEMKQEDSFYIGIAKRAMGDMRKAINILAGDFEDSSNMELANFTFEALLKMPKADRINLAFRGEPEAIFGKLWEMVKTEKRWEYLTSLADCSEKMGRSVHKTIFLASFLEKLRR